VFDTQRFLNDQIGEPTKMEPLFRAYGMEAPRFEAVRKWYQRGSIPADWFVLILCVIELDKGEPVRLAPYVS